MHLFWGNWSWHDGSDWWLWGLNDGMVGVHETRATLVGTGWNRGFHDYGQGSDKLGVVCQIVGKMNIDISFQLFILILSWHISVEIWLQTPTLFNWKARWYLWKVFKISFCVFHVFHFLLFTEQEYNFFTTKNETRSCAYDG